MSVTITISNNRQHSLENKTIEYVEYECQRCSFYGIKKDCHECGGNGKVRFEMLPFEMNLANANFSMLWNSLALPFDWSGSIDPKLVLPVIASTPTELLQRETQVTKGNCVVISFGVDHDQAESYLTRLKAIAEEADRRKQPIVWG